MIVHVHCMCTCTGLHVHIHVYTCSLCTCRNVRSQSHIPVLGRNVARPYLCKERTLPGGGGRVEWHYLRILLNSRLHTLHHPICSSNICLLIVTREITSQCHVVWHPRVRARITCPTHSYYAPVVMSISAAVKRVILMYYWLENVVDVHCHWTRHRSVCI